MGNKTGTRRTVTEEEIEIEHTNGTEALTAIKAFVLEGAPYNTDALAEYEFNIKATMLDRAGTTKKGFYTTTDDLEHFVERIVEDRGPGRYNIWVQFRKVGDDERKWNVSVFKDQRIYDPEEDYTRAEVEEIPQHHNPPESQRDTLMQFMQESNRQQTTLMTSIITALLGNKGAGDGSAKAIVEAIQSGIDLAKKAEAAIEFDEEEENPPESPMEKLAMQAIPLLQQLFASKDPNVGITADTVRQLAKEHLTVQELAQLAQDKHDNVHQLPAKPQDA